MKELRFFCDSFLKNVWIWIFCSIFFVSMTLLIISSDYKKTCHKVCKLYYCKNPKNCIQMNWSCIASSIYTYGRSTFSLSAPRGNSLKKNLLLTACVGLRHLLLINIMHNITFKDTKILSSINDTLHLTFKFKIIKHLTLLHK